MTKINFIASVSDDKLHQTKQIAEKLKAQGCSIKEVYEAIGTISGSADLQVNVTNLKIPGIDSIEIERSVKKYRKK